MVARTRLNVTLHEHILSCFLKSRNNLERQPRAMKTCWGMDFHLHAFLTSKLQGDILSAFSSGRNIPLHHKTESSCAPLSALYCLDNRKPSCPYRLTDSNSSVVRTNRVNKNPSAWNFLSPKPEVTCGTVFHHNSSRFTFPIFAHSCRFSVLHSLKSITPRIY